MVAELNTKVPAEPKTINLHSDGFDIRFDYDSLSNKSIVSIMPHGVSIKMEVSDLAMWLGLKKNEILLGTTPTVSPFLANMERYTTLYAYTDIIQNQLVSDVKTPFFRVVSVK